MKKPSAKSISLVNSLAFVGTSGAVCLEIAAIVDYLVGDDDKKLHAMYNVIKWAKGEGECEESYNTDCSGE